MRTHIAIGLISSTLLVAPAGTPEGVVSEPPTIDAPSLPAAQAAGCRVGVTSPAFGVRDLPITPDKLLRE